MDNYQIAESFSLLSKLMDIHGENAFKAKTYASAAYTIERLPVALSDTPRENISSLKGIGASTAAKIIELLDNGSMSALQEIILLTPPGILEMLQIKGIGPKKISVIWKEMQIESIGELLYACEENRLKTYKGFGEKTQENIRESIQFYLHNQGFFLYAQAELLFAQMDAYLKQLFAPAAVAVTGGYRRQEPVIEEMAFVIQTSMEVIKQKMQTAHPPEIVEEDASNILYQLRNGLKLRFHSAPDDFAIQLFTSTNTPEFQSAFDALYSNTSIDLNAADDDQFFTTNGLPNIPAYLRENSLALEKAMTGSLPNIIQPQDIRGIIHSHSNWSDGGNTIEEMALAAKERGLEYLVISDHSKTAFYANGLSEERIREQHHYIDELNAKLAPFVIFKSIESDILNDGQLDYSNAILSTFDIVIASVHSNLKMTEEKAMQRLLTAIANPYTSILGHPTGRLLLSRRGYPVDFKTLIDACAGHEVVVELNAHPSRLDIDWRHIDYALERKVLISIDPDAHEIAGLDDTRYGVLAAQKAMVTAKDNLSSFSLSEFQAFVDQQKKKRSR